MALKVMAIHLAAIGSARQRFTREARAAAAIVHPHVMALHLVNSSGRLRYLLMPYVACETLQPRASPAGLNETRTQVEIG